MAAVAAVLSQPRATGEVSSGRNYGIVWVGKALLEGRVQPLTQPCQVLGGSEPAALQAGWNQWAPLSFPTPVF